MWDDHYKIVVPLRPYENYALFLLVYNNDVWIGILLSTLGRDSIESQKVSQKLSSTLHSLRLQFFEFFQLYFLKHLSVQFLG